MPPARRPERIVRLNSSGLLIRDCCGSTTPPVKAVSLLARKNQTASCSRPLRRRAARTARPARVRIRSRKPWTLARRRLFGWNVRLLTGTPGRWGQLSLSQGQACRALCAHDMGAPDMAQPVNGTGDPRTGQTGPLRSVKDRDFHNVSTAGDLGCGKSSPKDAFGGWLPPRDGETAPQPTCTPVDEPVDNELRLAIRLIEPIAARARLRGEGSHR